MRPEKGKLWETVWNQTTSASPAAPVGVSNSPFPYTGASLLCLFSWSNGEPAVYGRCWVYHAPPGGCSTLWFLVISNSVQLACSLTVRMPVSISVVLGLPTEEESIADVGALVCSNLRIADGLSPIPWNAVFENFAEGCPVGCSCVPDKAEAERESQEEVDNVGATPENGAYGTPKQSRGRCIKGGRTRKGDENKASSSQSKGKGNKKAQASPPNEFAAAGTDSQSFASKKARIGFQAWKDGFNRSKKN